MKTVIELPENYVVLDTETTGMESMFDEIIEVGLVKVFGGVETTYSSLIRPRESHDYLPTDEEELSEEEIESYFQTHLLSKFITSLTGITNDMVLSAPYFEDKVGEIAEFISDLPIIGHNVTFDVRFLNAAAEDCGHAPFENKIIDTMRFARKLLPELEHHRLGDVCDALSVNNIQAHRALRDALATRAIYEKMRAMAEAQGVDSFIASFKKTSNKLSYSKYIEGIVPANTEIDDTNPIYKKTVVFTGTLSNMTRKAALQLVMDLGGIPSDSLTKATNFLVVGNGEFVHSVKNGKTAKMKKAEDYRFKGRDIITLSETAFFQMIGMEE